MAMGLWSNGRHDGHALAAQVAALHGELRALRKQVRRRGMESYDDARDATADLVESLRDNLATGRALVARRAGHAGEAMREHPGATAAAGVAVGMVVLGLMAALIYNRSGR